MRRKIRNLLKLKQGRGYVVGLYAILEAYLYIVNHPISDQPKIL